MTDHRPIVEQEATARREREILDLKRRDFSFAEIAKRLNLTRETVAGVVYRYNKRRKPFSPKQDSPTERTPQ